MNYTHPLTSRARAAGLSNRQLAREAGLDPNWIDRLSRPNLADENVIRRPSIARLEKLAAVLQCDARDLVDPSYQHIVYELPADQPIIENVPAAVVPLDLQTQLRAAIGAYNREHASYLSGAALA